MRSGIPAACALAAARLWTWTAPGSALRWASSPPHHGEGVIAAGEIQTREAYSRAVAGLGVRVFRASCLEQSLALVMLLTSAGIPSHLVVGVSRRVAFRAHAWVESRGAVVFGDRQRGGFVPIVPTPQSPPAANTCPG